VTRQEEESAHDELSAYTLTHGDPAFLHQHVVDAWAAQQASATSKPIGVFFAMVGLYVLVEHGFTGREVQDAHRHLAQQRTAWPIGELPAARGTITAIEVMAAAEGPARDAMIHAWCRSVWAEYGESRGRVDALLRQRGILPRTRAAPGG